MQDTGLLLVIYIVGFAAGALLTLGYEQHRKKRQRERRKMFIKKRNSSQTDMYSLAQAMNRVGEAANRASGGLTIFKAAANEMTEQEFHERLKRDSNA